MMCVECRPVYCLMLSIIQYNYIFHNVEPQAEPLLSFTEHQVTGQSDLHNRYHIFLHVHGLCTSYHVVMQQTISGIYHILIHCIISCTVPYPNTPYHILIHQTISYTIPYPGLLLIYHTILPYTVPYSNIVSSPDHYSYDTWSGNILQDSWV